MTEFRSLVGLSQQAFSPLVDESFTITDAPGGRVDLKLVRVKETPGAFQIFIVPVGRDPSGAQYQAVFN